MMTPMSVPRTEPTRLATFRVDRASPVPLYFQVAQHLEQAIASGEIPHGTLFENEITLAEQLSLSRPTMRRAMGHLVDQGLVVRRRGVGTRVVQPKVRRPLELTSLHDDLTRTGQQPTTEVLSLATVPASEEVAGRLGVAVGEGVTELVRLRSASGRPLAQMTNHLPARLGELDRDRLEAEGLYGLLRSRGVQLHSATQVVGARTATAAEARALGEPRGSALLTMTRHSFDDHGIAVEYAAHVYAASRYSFEIDLLSS